MVELYFKFKIYLTVSLTKMCDEEQRVVRSRKVWDFCPSSCHQNKTVFMFFLYAEAWWTLLDKGV